MKNHPYKNFVAYTVTPGFIIDLGNVSRNRGEEFEEELLKHVSLDPSPQAWRSIGLVCPVDEGVFFHTVVPGTFLLAVQFNERILPGKVRDEHLLKRIASIEEREDRKLSRKEYAQLRDDVEHELLPKAFIRRSIVYVMFTGKNKLFVFTSSAKRADEVISLLSHVLPWDMAKCRLIDTEDDPASLLRTVAIAARLRDLDDSIVFEADDAAVLHGTEKRTIRIKDRDIYGDEVQKLIKSGYEPSELRMTYGEEAPDDEEDRVLVFTLNTKLVFKRVQFTDFTMESHNDAQDDGDERYAFCSFSMLVANRYSALVNDVIEQLGGLHVPKPAKLEEALVDEEDDEL
jgi:recombination associated protein RdgC